MSIGPGRPLLVAGYGAVARALIERAGAAGLPHLAWAGPVDGGLPPGAAEAGVALVCPVGDESFVRRSVLAVDDHVAPDRPLAVSLLGGSVARQASWCNVPRRVVGFGLVPPLAPTSVAELAAGPASDPAALESPGEALVALGLDTARTADGPGGVLGRIIVGLVNEAAFALGEQVADAGAIDTATRLGLHYPRGPLEWGDRLGLDQVVAALEALEHETGDTRYRVAPLLRRQVWAGHRGWRAGPGSAGDPRFPRVDGATDPP